MERWTLSQEPECLFKASILSPSQVKAFSWCKQVVNAVEKDAERSRMDIEVVVGGGAWGSGRRITRPPSDPWPRWWCTFKRWAKSQRNNQEAKQQKTKSMTTSYIEYLIIPEIFLLVY